MRWKGTAWQLVAPTLLELRRRPRGRLLWRAFEWVGERLGGLPLHEVDPALASGREPVATLPRVSLTESADLRARVAQVPVWWHSIDLRRRRRHAGSEEHSTSSPRRPANLRLGDLTGKSVLDIGAWDGYFSFAAERRGAERVVALDHYTWSMDLGAYGEVPRAAPQGQAARRRAGVPARVLASGTRCPAALGSISPRRRGAARSSRSSGTSSISTSTPSSSGSSTSCCTSASSTTSSTRCWRSSASHRSRVAR